MASAPPPPTQGKPRLWKLTGVSAFATGEHRGQPWTSRDIDAMVRNQRLYGHLVKPAVVIGHEETQPLTEGLPATVTQNTGEPGFGRVAAARRQVERGPDGTPQTVLDLDLEDVPDWLAALIRGKAYRRVSVEVYDDPPSGLEKAEGPILRRVAFLGGEIPQVKTLRDLPMPEYQEYAERRTAAVPRGQLRLVRSCRTDRGRIATFAERRPMKTCKQYADFTDKTKATLKRFADDTGDGPAAPEGVDRQTMIDALADAGVDVSAITDAVPDEVLAEWVRSVTSQSAPAAAAPADTPAEKPADSQMDDTMTPTSTAPPTTDMAAKHPASVTLKYSENGKTVTRDVPLADIVGPAVKAALAGLQGQAESTAKLVASQHADAKRAGLEAFCEAMVKAGKLLPAERDAGILEMAMGLDAVAVHKFSDGKSQTTLDRWKASVEARPVLLSFAERAKAGKGGAEAKDADEAVLKGHFQTFSETYTKGGIDEAKLIAGFKAEKKLRPKLTAHEYLDIPQYGVPA